MTTFTYPEVSIVVPVHNKAATIERVLEAVATAASCCKAIGISIEIIVIDDHSNNVSGMQSLQDSKWIKYFRRSGGHPSAAAARNLGIDHATGRWLLLLDADVLIPAPLLNQLIALNASERDVVLIPTIGSSMSIDTWPLMAPEAPLDAADLTNLRWRFLADARAGVLLRCSDSLAHLPAPWVFNWTTALWVRRDFARKVGGFDVTLAAKGSEDIAFGLRLYEAGAHFRLPQLPAVLHIPHSRNRKKEESLDREHERALLRRSPTAEVEAFVAFDASNANRALECLRRVRLPTQRWGDLAMARASLPPGKRLLLLANDPTIRQELAPTEWAAPGATGGGLPLWGLALPHDDGHFASVVLLEGRGVLPEEMIARILQEATRVARTVFWLQSDANSANPTLDLEAWRSFDRPYWERSMPIRRYLHDWRGLTVFETSDVRLVQVHPAWGNDAS